jgi:hypothetical protein
MVSRGIVSLLCSAGVILLPVAALGADPGGAETPEAVYARALAAAETEDVGEMFACLAPEERAETTMMMVVMTGFMVGMAGMAAEMGGEMGEAFVDESSPEGAAQLEAQKAEAAAQVGSMTERWEEILERHGLSEMMEGPEPEDGASAAAALADVDQGALVNELVTFLDEFGDDEGSGDTASSMAAPIGELEDLAVDGDSATARVGEEDVRFERVDGRWYITGGLDELD